MNTVDQNFTYQGIDIACRKLGKGRPLLILHGWGSNSRVMMPLAELLAHLRTCYVVDLPGFGDSQDPPLAWSVDDYTDFVEHFIRGLDAESVDILAHSFGGRITLKLCARDSGKKLVNRVLITGGAGMKPKRTVKFFIKKYLAKLLKLPFSVLPGKLREQALSRLRSTRVWKMLGSQDYNRLSGIMRETFVKSVTEHLEPCLPHIDKEVLLLWGRNDGSTPLYQAERMEQGIKGAALVVIENAGHYAFLDRPKHFASIAEAFFDSFHTS